MMNEKEKLRRSLRERRKSLSKRRREEAQRVLTEELYPFLAPYKKILSFASSSDEIDLWPLNKVLYEENRLLLPRVRGKKLDIYHIRHLDKMILSPLGILEPDPHKEELWDIGHIRCALIPALGFDCYKHRLGYGKGYFDRLLYQLKDCVTIGIGFKEQLVEGSLPVEDHDQILGSIQLF